MEAVPRSFFSWNFEILENSQKIADLDMSSWREKGLVQVDGANFTISKEGFINPTFTFSQDNTELATATKETMLSHGFVVDVDGKRFYLKKKSSLEHGRIVILYGMLPLRECSRSMLLPVPALMDWYRFLIILSHLSYTGL